MGTVKFDSRVSYAYTLLKLKESFDALWEQNQSSPTTGLIGYEILALLGAGNFGRVKLVRSKSTGKYYAVKVMSKDHIVKMKHVNSVCSEKKVLQCINFPFLVSLQFSSKDYDNLYLGLQFVNGGELFKHHRKMRKLNERQARFYAVQVFMGLDYLHQCCVLYRDLKPENILIDSEGYIKITDFGFAKKVEGRTLSLCGTPEYLAPEIIKSKPYGSSVDWWAYGVLLYELVAGYSPFSPFKQNIMNMYDKICNGTYTIPEYFSPALKDLVGNLLEIDVTKRYGSLSNGRNDIKYHDWFKNVDWYAVLNKEIEAPFVPIIQNMEDLSNFDKMPSSNFLSQEKASTTNYYDSFFKGF